MKFLPEYVNSIEKQAVYNWENFQSLKPNSMVLQEIRTLPSDGGALALAGLAYSSPPVFARLNPID